MNNDRNLLVAIVGVGAALAFCCVLVTLCAIFLYGEPWLLIR